jgi:hypothetical protein
MTRVSFLAYAVLSLALLTPTVASAESTAVQIRLHGDSGGRYIVPPGKVLLVEHIEFCDYWVSQTDPLIVYIEHSTNPTGSVWSSSINYFSAHNYLPRPLRIPAGAAISMPNFGNLLYKTFVYGILMDAPSQIITP